MLASHRYVIHGDPIPLARSRFAHGRVFDPQKLKKQLWMDELAYQHLTRPFFSGPLHLDIVFYMPIPKLSKKIMERIDGAAHYKRPDLDNMLKFVCDTCNGVLVKDDAAFAIINSRKVYSHQPRTEFIITELKDEVNLK